MLSFLILNGFTIRSPLYFLAVTENNFNLVKQLVDSKFNQNIKDISGLTPLMISIQSGFYDIAFYLISHGSNLSIKDNDEEISALRIIHCIMQPKKIQPN